MSASFISEACRCALCSQASWNKVSTIRKTLEETPASVAEWIMWVDIDTIVPDMTVTPRFEEYEGKDLVVWGDRKKVVAGKLEGALSFGCHLCI